MAQPVYSVRLAVFHAGAGATIVVPAGFRVVIRDVSAFNGSVVAEASAQLVHDASSVTIYKRTLSEQQWLNDELRVVIDEGESVTCSGDSTVDMYVSGYQLSLP